MALAAAALVLWGSPRPGGQDSEATQAIRDVLRAQVDGWNRGDLEAYMAGYWNSSALVFQSNTTVTRGFRPTLERYRQRYQGAGKEMGLLAFEGLEVELLGQDAALVRGGFHLRLRDGREPKGLFTLIFRRLPGVGWRIVHDHTSGE